MAGSPRPLWCRPGSHLQPCTIQLSQRFAYRGLKLGQAGSDVSSQMDAQRPPLAFRQHAEITSRLGCFHYAERVSLPRHRQIILVVAGNLQKNAGVRAALVGLAGGMQKTRTKAEAGGVRP